MFDLPHPHSTTDEALASLGVDPGALSEEQYRQLDAEGFLVLPDLVDAQWLQELRDQLDLLAQREGGAAGHEIGKQASALVLADLLNKGEVFERMLRVPQVLAATHHVLGDMQVNSLNFRSAQPGLGHQALHSDSGTPGADGDYRICNSIWMIDDFTEDNGSTRAVPATHRSAQVPGDAMANANDPHPDQIQITGKAGTVVVFNAHLWHGGTENRSDDPRRGLTLSFSRRDQPQQTDQAAHIRKAVYDRLSPAERYLMNV
jgi:ectoine hydroxylase-related dioxygenase (phytanoyl-CoA dioxygenase family)